MNIEDYTTDEFEKSFKKILNDLITIDISPVKSPKAYILGGQPGSGKSILNNYTKKINNRNLIIINGDEYRQYHPHFSQLEEKYGIDFPKFTSKFSSQVVERLIDELSDKKYNLCIEGTLRTVTVPINTCKLLKSKGYNVSLNIMATKKDISYLSTQLRYYKFLEKKMIARATPKEHHDKVFDVICDNLNEIYKQKLFDDIKIFDRELKLLYDNSHKELPGSLLYDFYNSPYTEKEIESLTQIISNLKLLSGKNYENYLSKEKSKSIDNNKELKKTSLLNRINNKKEINTKNNNIDIKRDIKR